MLDVNKIVGDVTKSIDDNVFSAEEQAASRTERHSIDTTSPFKLPHLIRPISLIWTLSLLTITDLLAIVLAFKYTEDPTIIVTGISVSVAGMVTMILKYYFQGRSNEKIEAKKARVEAQKVEAAIKIEAIRTRAEIKQEKKAARKERRNV